jgi:hypothetical protein
MEAMRRLLPGWRDRDSVPRRRLFLHAGTHKTGTTSLQQLLFDNRRWLMERGLVYANGVPPFSDRRSHHRLARAIVGGSRLDLWRAGRFFRALRSEGGPSDTILISAESIYRHISGRYDFDCYRIPDYWERRRRYLERFANLARDYDVTVILFFREKESFAKSLYGELTGHKKWTGREEEFRSALAPWFEYDRQVALFREVFGRVIVLDYDAALSKGVVATFFAAIGFPMPPGAEHVWLNRSGTTPMAEKPGAPQESG